MHHLDLLIIGLYIYTIVLLVLPGFVLFKRRRVSWTRATATTSNELPNTQQRDGRRHNIRTGEPGLAPPR